MSNTTELNVEATSCSKEIIIVETEKTEEGANDQNDREEDELSESHLKENALERYRSQLANNLSSKPRSYSDTSPHREVILAIKGKIRSCKSFMHFPHINTLSISSRQRDPSLYPHLHQSFSHMHLPHTNDSSDEDFPTVSVIALAESREIDGADDVIDDKDDVKNSCCSPMDHVEDMEDSDAMAIEQAIYTWEREDGQTRSISEPKCLYQISADKDEIEYWRPCVMSFEGAEKVKKPPSRLQFEQTLEELEEENASETMMDSVNEEADLDNITKSSILVLAESGHFEADSGSPPQDQVLTHWTRYDSHPIKKSSFSVDLSSIQEKLGEAMARDSTTETTCRSKNSSLLELVDEVTKDVMSNEKMVSQTGNQFGEMTSEIDDKTDWISQTSARLRRRTLATASPTREEHSYATEIEREAFNKISQWKTDFAVKLEDVLNKGSERQTQKKQQKIVVVNVPMDLNDNQLRDLKEEMLIELRRKSNAGKPDKSLLPQRRLPGDYPSLYLKEEVEQKNGPYPRYDTELQKDTQELGYSSPLNLEKVAISKEKITELLQWHDQERERLLLELKKMQVSREFTETPCSSAQVVLDSASLEKVFCSLHVIMDSIFKETILRLTGTLESDILEEKSDVKSTEKQCEKEGYDSLAGTEVRYDVQSQPRGGGGGEEEEEENQQHQSSKKTGKSDEDNVTVQPRKTDEVQNQSKVTEHHTQESRIPEPVVDRHTNKVNRNKPKQGMISSYTQDKPQPIQAAYSKRTGTKSPSQVHVHTTGFAEHVCHRETCAGMAEDSSTCECDSASDQIDTTDSNDYCDETTGLGEYDDSSSFEILTGRPAVEPGRSSTNDTDITPSSSTDIPQVEYSSTPRDQSFYKNTENSESSTEELEEENRKEGEEESVFEESDACSEIADLLGVFHVYNAAKDHGNEDLPPRPQAPGLMTYEEKDMKYKLKRQKTRLKGYKRIVRSFKAKNKRLKEEQLHLRRQIKEWHERCAKKEARTTELKHEIQAMSSLLMENYRRTLEEKSNTIEMKGKKMLNLPGTDGKRLSDDYTQDTVGKCDKESNWERHEPECNKYLKFIIRDKEEVIKELVKQHEMAFQEITNKINKVTSERDELKKENYNLRQRISVESENFEMKKKLGAQVLEVQKILKEANQKYGVKERLNQGIIQSLQNKSHECKETQTSFEELEISSSYTTEEQENEIQLLKASIDAFQCLIRRFKEQSDLIRKLTRPTRGDHDVMKKAPKEAVSAKEGEVKRHQETQAQQQEANYRVKEIHSMVDKDNVIAKMKEELESLRSENSKLKTNVERKKESTSTLVHVNELQSKLAQREREIKELKRKEKTRLKRLKLESSRAASLRGQEITSQLDPEDSSGQCLSLAQLCARQWEDESELQQQELDDLDGQISDSKPTTYSKDTLRIRKDVNELKLAVERYLRAQILNRGIAQDELKKKLELRAVKDLEKQETLYKQIIETKETSYAETLKEKDAIIQVLSESKRFSQSETEALGKTIKDVLEKGISKKIDEWRKSIDMTLKLPFKTDVFHEVISDLLQVNQKTTKRLEDCTERAWTNVKEDIDELKDFTFKMTDAVEKHFYSTHERLLNNSIDEVIKYVKNESNSVRKSFLEGMQAHYEGLVEEIQRQGPAGMTLYDKLQTSIDGYNRCNVREFHQARRDVLLAAEAVSNSAEELYHIKNALTREFSPNEVGQLIKKENEVMEKIKATTKPFEGSKTIEHEEYSSKGSGTLKDYMGLSLTGTTTYVREEPNLSATAELANLEGSRLRDSLSNMVGEPSRGMHEEGLRHNYQPALFQTLPSRESDSLSLRERLQQRSKARGRNNIDGLSYSDPYATKIAPFWSRDKPSSSS